MSDDPVTSADTARHVPHERRCKALNYRRLSMGIIGLQAGSQKNGYSLSNCAHNGIRWHGAASWHKLCALSSITGVIAMVLVASAQVPTTLESAGPLSNKDFLADEFDHVLRDHVRDGRGSGTTSFHFAGQQ
jgi:hypothetical protein